MRVAVVQPMFQGHHLNHVRLLLDGLRRTEGVRPVLATSDAATRSPQFAEWVRPLVEAGGVEVETSTLSGADSGGAAVRAIAASLGTLARDRTLDHLLLPYGDGVVQHAARLRLIGRLRLPKDCEAEALMLRGRFAYQPPTGLRDRLWTAAWLASLSAAPFGRLHHLDPFILADIVRRRPGQRHRWGLMPDPVEPLHADMDRATARRRLDLPVEGRIVGCVGALDGRKGVPTLIEAFATAARDGRLGPDDRLLLVGEQDAECRDAARAHAADLAAAGRVVARDRFVSDDEMEASLAAMDLVATLYPGHVGSASIIIRAAGHGRFVLGPRFGWMGRVVPAFGLGHAIEDAGDAGAVAAALPGALEAAADHRPTDAARRFVAFHTEVNFQAHFTRRLRERLGLPPLPTREWADVTAGTPLADGPTR